MDAGSLEALLVENDWMRRLARQLVSDAAAADDLVQQAWSELLSARTRIDPDRPIRAFLATILRRGAAKMQREIARRSRRESHGATPESTAIPSPSDLVSEAERQRRLVDVVLALDEPYRETVLLRWYRDLAPAAIATHLGIPVGTVETRLKRAHARLREELTRHEGGDARRWAIAWMPIAIHTPVESAAAGFTFTLGALVMSKGFVVAMATALVAVTAAIFLASQDEGQPSLRRAQASPSDPMPPAPVVDHAIAPQSGIARELVVDAPKGTSDSGATDVVPPQCVLRVLDADGNPIADANIAIERTNSWTPIPGRTDASGEVALTRESGSVAVWVLAMAIAPSRTEISLVDERATLMLPRGCAIEGRVVVDGKPPRKPVTVALYPEGARNPFPILASAPPELFDWIKMRTSTAAAQLFAQTDAAGNFRFSGLAEGFSGWLHVSDQTHARDVSKDRGSFHAPAIGIVIAMRSKPFVSGRVLLPEGGPAAGAMVTLDLGTSDDSGTSHSQRQTEADGTFVIPFAIEGADRLSLDIRAPEGMTATRRLEGKFEGEVSLGDVILAPGRRCRVRAQDEIGRPLGGAVAFLVNDPQHRSDPTDAVGEASFVVPSRPATTAADSTLVVHLAGRELAVVPLPVGEHEVALATLPRCTKLVVQLEPADVEWPHPLRLIASAKVDRAPLELDGLRALAGVSLPFDRSEPEFWNGYLSFAAETDEHGTCSLERLLPNVEWVLRLYAPDLALLAETKVTLRPASEALAVLSPSLPRKLSGRVLDLAGRPVRAADVVAYWYEASGRRNSLDTNTRGDGRFVVSGIFGSSVDVVVSLEGWAPAYRDGLAVPPEGAAIDFVLESGSGVRVIVIGEDGVRKSGARVEALLRTSVNDTHPHVVVAKVDGDAYRFTALPSGRIDAQIVIDKVATPFSFDSSQPEVTVALEGK